MRTHYLSAIYGGMVAGPNAVEYMKVLLKHLILFHLLLYEQYENQEQEKWNEHHVLDGNENAYVLHKELGEWMTDNVTVVRYNDKLTRNR